MLKIAKIDKAVIMAEFLTTKFESLFFEENYHKINKNNSLFPFHSCGNHVSLIWVEKLQFFKEFWLNE